jgi:MoaA/NifB/PqqE/SkfB family radical SAM enzyme
VSAGGVKKKNGLLMFGYKDIKTVHLETTQLCQALCPMCDRTTLDGYVNPKLSHLSLSLEDIQNIFKPDFIKQLNKMYMCGNVGDPMMAPDCVDIAAWFRMHNEDMLISMVTNGGARDLDFWKSMTYYVNSITFSIDGLEDTNHIYRKGVKWSNIMKNTQAFIDNGGKAHWAYLVFEHNEHQIMDAFRLSQEMGFASFQPKTTSRYDKNRKAWQMYLRGKEQGTLTPPKKEKYQSEVYKNPIDYDDIKIVPKCVKNKEIYIAADGSVFPCCWAHTSLISSQNISAEERLDMIEQSSYYNINAKDIGLENAIKWFTSFSDRWNSDDKPYICKIKCNSKQDPVALQYIET